jgi:pyruvate dehydrogenase E2 component (dihydrolipoamide acetyltransferase)
MATEVRLPQLGLSTESARIVAWRVEIGQKVDAGQIIAEVETDKTALEIPAPATGYIRKIFVPAGTDAAMGHPIALITVLPDEPIEAALAPGVTTSAGPSGRSVDQNVRAFPAARRRARELSIDISTIRGSGSSGAVTVDDVEQSAAAATPGVTRPPASSQPSSKMRDAISRTVTESWAIPQFWVERVVSLEKAQARLERDHGSAAEDSPRLIDAILVACAAALKEQPGLLGNPSAGTVSIGYIVATKDGMLTPVIHGLESLSIAEVARKRRELVEKAQSGRLTPDELSGGDFTVSNLGPMGVDRFMALLVPSQAAILAVGSINGEGVVPRVSLTLTLDHRRTDGAAGAKFLADVVTSLDAPR